MALALGTLPLLLIEVDRSELHSADQRLLDLANIVVLVAFAIDYIVELVLADDRRSHVRREWTSALIVVTQALAVVPSLAAFGILRALRAARLIRIVVVVGSGGRCGWICSARRPSGPTPKLGSARALGRWTDVAQFGRSVPSAAPVNVGGCRRPPLLGWRRAESVDG